MLGTYAAFLVILGCSAAVGQVIHSLAGRSSWSPISPAVGLAALLAIAWATVRLPGEGVAAVIAVGVLTVVAVLVLGSRPAGRVAAARSELPLVLAGALAASLPFIVEMRFGILGTGLNPDMSQHLFAVDRLVDGGTERLISEGYPLGPHALVAAVAALGPSTVEAFDGLMIAVAVATCLAALGALGELRGWRRVAAALVVGFAYLLAANYVQGAFKEAIQALFVLAFAVGLGERRPSADPAAPGGEAEEAGGTSVFRARVTVPLAALAIGSVYAYSFPGLAWLAGTALAWGAIELLRAGAVERGALLRSALAPAALGLGLLAAAIAPELGRISSFASFETFDPDGAGLGNLFDRLSPLEAFGIWPSGDFRVEPGDGAVPAIAFYAGAAFGAAAFGFGTLKWLRGWGSAIPAAVAAAAVLWLYARVGGTPYQEAKTLVILAPLVVLVSVRGLLAAAPLPLALAFLAAAGGSGALALVNGPVGPSGYSPELAEVRGDIGEESVYVSAPRELLEEQHGRDYLVWELRGNHICIADPDMPLDPGGATLLPVAVDEDGAVVPEGVYTSRSEGAPPEADACPLIEDGARADPAGDD